MLEKSMKECIYAINSLREEIARAYTLEELMKKKSSITGIYVASTAFTSLIHEFLRENTDDSST